MNKNKKRTGIHPNMHPKTHPTTHSTLRRGILVAILAALLCSCGTVAFTGRKQMLLFSDSQITELSKSSYKEFMSSAKISSSKKDSQILVQVGKRMTEALEAYLKKSGNEGALSGITWDYKLVASKEVNAFCMPSGNIVFYEGILQYANTPDYIAVVMGHEMAHAIAKHGNERMSQQAALNVLGSAAGEVIGSTKGTAAKKLFMAGFGMGSQVGILLPYSRKHEYEADRIGLYLMAIAGYDIEAAPKFWEKMASKDEVSSKDETSGKENSSQNDFFSTHPCDSKRIEALREALPEARKYIGL